MISAKQENILTLAARLGIVSQEADKLVDQKLRIITDDRPEHATLGRIVYQLLSRTFTDVRCEYEYQLQNDALLIAIGQNLDTSGMKSCTALLRPEGVIFDAVTTENSNPVKIPFALLLIAGCYLASNCIRKLIPGIADGQAPVKTILWDELFPTIGNSLSEIIDIGNTTLVGAGAIGNGFIWALSDLNLRGRLSIIDPDPVSDGNINRNVLNHPPDIKRLKVDVLKSYIKIHCPKIKVTAIPTRFEDYAKECGSNLRIDKMITAVDSRRMRRKLQAYCPKQVFDASTNGLSDIIYHYHGFPLTGACLACIHAEKPDETAREKHIANVLGVHIDDVRQGFISEIAARNITRRNQQINWMQIVGDSYDSLFKELCASGKLPIDSTGTLEPTLAPFCFVSVLAGTVLAMEFLSHCIGQVSHDYNFWRINPWISPRGQLKMWKNKIDNCEFCGDQTLLQALNLIWGENIDHKAI